MRKKALLLLGICLLLAVGIIVAAPGDLLNGFSIGWWTADAGGGNSSGGPYTLRGTAGQPDSGRASGGNFALKSGFWATLSGTHESLPKPTEIFLPSVIG